MITTRQEASLLFYSVKDGNKKEKIIFKDNLNKEQTIVIKFTGTGGSGSYVYDISIGWASYNIKYQKKGWLKVAEILNKHGFKDNTLETDLISNMPKLDLDKEKSERKVIRVNDSEADDSIVDIGYNILNTKEYNPQSRLQAISIDVQKKMKKSLIDITVVIKEKVIDDLIKQKIYTDLIKEKLLKGFLKENIYDQLIKEQFFNNIMVDNLFYDIIIKGYLDHRENVIKDSGKIKLFVKPGSGQDVSIGDQKFFLDYADDKKDYGKIFGISGDPGLIIENGLIQDIAYSRDCLNKNRNSIQNKIYRNYQMRPHLPTMVLFRNEMNLIVVGEVIRAYKNNAQAKKAGEPEAYGKEDLDVIRQDPENVKKFGRRTKWFEDALSKYSKSIEHPYIVIKLINPNENNNKDIGAYLRKEKCLSGSMRMNERIGGCSRYVDKELFNKTFY